MTHQINRLSFTIAVLLSISTSVFALEKPKKIDEIWKIIEMQQKQIEMQQKQIEALQKKGNATSASQPAIDNTNLPSSTPTIATNDVKKLERKTDVLSQEVEKLRTNLSIPEDAKYKSMYGMGPAASKVYGTSKGLSIGGYGEAMYTNYVDAKGNQNNKDTADLERAVIYLGYKFNDWIVLNNEIEFEHATTGEGAEEKGEVSVEFSQLDFFLDQKYNIRAGLMLVPMGFVNEMHEPTTYHGNHRPDIERYIIPSTWREMGAGLFGEVLPGLQYRMYAMTGLNAQGFSNVGIMEGRQGGSNAKADDFAFTGRLDYSPTQISGLLFGASTFLGNSGQNDVAFNNQKYNVFTQLYEGHIQYKYRGLELRALGAFSHIDDTAFLNPNLGSAGPLGKESFGWYVEAAHDIMPLLWKESDHYLAPFFRLERYNTLSAIDNNSLIGSTFDSRIGLDRWIYQAGISYKPIPNIVIKADYRNINDRKIVPMGIPNGDEFNFGVGFIY